MSSLRGQDVWRWRCFSLAKEVQRVWLHLFPMKFKQEKCRSAFPITASPTSHSSGARIARLSSRTCVYRRCLRARSIPALDCYSFVGLYFGLGQPHIGQVLTQAFKPLVWHMCVQFFRCASRIFSIKSSLFCTLNRSAFSQRTQSNNAMQPTRINVAFHHPCSLRAADGER